MTNREYIDQINTFINNFLQQERTKNGYISRDFFDDKELKTKILNVFNSLTLTGMIPEVNEEKLKVEELEVGREELKEGEYPKLNREKEPKPKNEMERLERTATKAAERVDFYERVVRSVAREEKDLKEYNEVLGKKKTKYNKVPKVTGLDK